MTHVLLTALNSYYCLTLSLFRHKQVLCALIIKVCHIILLEIIKKTPFIFLDDNEERAIIEPRSLEDPRVKELVQVLIDWINDALATQRIIVKDISEDLYDGQVLQKLLEMLTETKLDVPEVTQSEEGQRQKLTIVLRAVNRV